MARISGNEVVRISGTRNLRYTDAWVTYANRYTQYDSVTKANVQRDLQQVLAHELDHLVNNAPHTDPGHGGGIFTTNTVRCEGY